MKINSKTRGMSTEKLVLVAIFTALVAILSYLGGFIKIGGFASISLTLIPVVLGAAMCGPWAGAWLGGVSGAVFFMTPDAAFWLSLSVHGTIITVLLKGILAGLCAGLIYKLLERFNRYVAVMASAVACPVVNTGIFILGCFVFFMDTVNGGAAAEGISVAAYIIIFFVGLNFVFELLSNLIFSPVIVRILDIANSARKNRNQ
ncbi:MAG: ECF transporter S component [Eubacteriales bacterium]